MCTVVKIPEETLGWVFDEMENSDSSNERRERDEEEEE